MIRAGIDKRAMTALSGGHLAVDFASGSVPALIPFLTDRFHLSYALAAMLLLAATASSSLVQASASFNASAHDFSKSRRSSR